MVERMTKKRRSMLDITLLITTEERLLDTKNAKIIELIRECMAITDATLDRERKNEREVATMKKELDHLHHQVEYYQN
jgi:hypothetical protein